jgi:hypothetical protein
LSKQSNLKHRILHSCTYRNAKRTVSRVSIALLMPGTLSLARLFCVSATCAGIRRK